MSDTILFQSYELGNNHLNNRMVMAPMTRSRSANEGNVATELTATYYEQRATAGLIITEGTFVSKKAVGFINTRYIQRGANSRLETGNNSSTQQGRKNICTVMAYWAHVSPRPAQWRIATCTFCPKPQCKSLYPQWFCRYCNA